MTDWPTASETCYAYIDDADERTRCIRPRGHASSHTTARGMCWPNTSRPGTRYIGPRTSITTIVNPRTASRNEWRDIL